MTDLMAELREVVDKIDAYRALTFNNKRRDMYTDASSAAVELIRTHHAELEAMARDAESWRQLLASVGAEQLVAASTKFGDAEGVLRDAARYRWLRKSTRESFWIAHGVIGHLSQWTGEHADREIDQAMHNSAREG